MKKASLLILTLLLSFLIPGCAHFPTATRTVSIPPGISSDQLIEVAIDAAREVGLPPATKIDKANGLVEFGGFGSPEIGTTGQVRVRADHTVELTLKRGSLYVPLSVEEMTEKFKSAIEAKAKQFAR